MPKVRLCKSGCGYAALKGRQFCRWHHLARQPIEDQVRAAEARLVLHAAEHRARVPQAEWPDGERWCSGCQSFIPLFYATGSRCRACASRASHGQKIEKLYGLSAEEYQDLLKWQGGRCYICHRLPRTLRLAVDHDHESGEVRGLLCANNENGCNRGVVANLEAAADGGLEAARRAVEYLERPPLVRMRAGEARPVSNALETRRPGDLKPPPF